MKKSTKLVSAVLMAVAHPASSFAQLEFYLGYGNAEFAALNGKQVGDRLSPLTRIPQIGGTFRVSMFVKNTGPSWDSLGGAMFVGFDSVQTQYNSRLSKESALGLGREKKIFADRIENPGTGYLGRNAEGPSTVDFVLDDVQPGRDGSYGSNFSVSFSAPQYSLGLYTPFRFADKLWPQNPFLTLQTGVSIRMANYSLTNRGLVVGDTYGDDLTENGLSIFHSNGSGTTLPTSRATFFSSNPRTIGNPGGNVKYAVQAVPEPGTMIAVAAGLAAFARRRRSK